MFFFRNHKTLKHKESALIGFVLAVMSILAMGVFVYIFPLFAAWLNVQGVYSLDSFLLVFSLIMLLAVQGLLLFGFPLYYARDKKSHMTGFQILVYALLWMLGLVALLSVLAMGML